MEASVPVCVPCESCSLNATTWIGPPVAKELNPSPSASLSQTSPLPSPSRSAWFGLGTSGQLSEASGTPSLSSSGSTQSAMPSPSVSRNPSSTTPLQLSSRPLQVSVVGLPGTHGWTCPPTQFTTVLLQAPTPHVVVPTPSSTGPSQSSSLPLQVAAVGVPGVQVCGTPPEQLFTVLVQAPTPHVVVPNPSSTRPSQLSSRPLHTSVAPGWIAGSLSSQSWLAGKPSWSRSWHASPMPLPSASSWPGLGRSGQLSQTSPRPSWSRSAWAVVGCSGQPSSISVTPSPSVSRFWRAQGEGISNGWPF